MVTISAIAIRYLYPLFFFKDHPTAVGFGHWGCLLLSAGFIGMRIAVLGQHTHDSGRNQIAHRSDADCLSMAAQSPACSWSGSALLSVGIFYTVASKMIGHEAAVRSLIGASPRARA